MRLLFLLTFLSGFAALIYQIVWIRELTLILGSTTACISTVVAAFMAGLAIGSAALGRWSDTQSPRRLVIGYAVLEIGIGITALMVFLLLPPLARIYPQLVSGGGGEGVLAVLRFALTFALLLLPTSLMGGTFPVLVKIVSSRGGGLGRSVGMLYGVNTAGAVAGALYAGLVLMEWLGVSGAHWVAVILNLLIGAAAFGLSGIIGRESDTTPLTGSATTVEQSLTSATPSRRARTVIVIAAAVSGGIALGYEIVWSRALSVVLGHSIYAFTFVLSTYLVGLAAGGMLVAPYLDRLQSPGRTMAGGLLALAVVAGASLYCIPLLPFVEYEVGVLWWDYVLKNLAGTAALLLPATLIMGALLPTAIRAYAVTWDTAGGAVGTVYAANTFGSIAGSLFSGFVLIPWIWTQQAFLLLVAINVILAGVVGIAFRWGRGWSAAAGAVATVLVAAFVIGESSVLRSKALARIGAGEGSGAKLLYYGEDQVALVGLVEFRNGVRMIFTNGSLMTHWGIETFWMSHLPMAAARNPRDVLVLCLGMGNTYVGATQHPASVTAVELSPEVVAAFHHLRSIQPTPPGEDPAGNGRIVVGDARNVVLVSREQFDVITVDPPPPLYSAGTAHFHTQEFYRLAKDRLRPGGVMCQWIPFRHCTVNEFRMLLRSYRVVFGNMQVWVPPSRMGAYLIGVQDGAGAALDPDAVRRRLLQSTTVATDLQRITDASVESVLPMPIMSVAEVDRFCGDAPVMTDNRPYLEFPLFRNSDPSLQLMRMQDLVPYIRPDWLSPAAE